METGWLWRDEALGNLSRMSDVLEADSEMHIHVKVIYQGNVPREVESGQSRTGKERKPSKDAI